MGRFDYEQFISEISWKKGEHDTTWTVDDKEVIYYYTDNGYEKINEALRNEIIKNNSFNINTLVNMNGEIQLAEEITSVIKKTPPSDYEFVYRWENSIIRNINTLEIDDIIGYQSFVSTSIDSEFTFYNRMEIKIKISEPIGVFIASYSKYSDEKELLIDKNSFFIVKNIDLKNKEIHLQHISKEDDISHLVNKNGNEGVV